MTVLDQSRANCVRVLVNGNVSSGTGFFLDGLHVATCFHVVADIAVTGPNAVTFTPRGGIRVELVTGELIDADCISQPSNAEPEPLNHDFAVLRLKSRATPAVQPSPLYGQAALPGVGSTVLFSGYPFGVPTMLTHQGVVSGTDQRRNLICVQSSINRGNSGGALLLASGEVVGIISMRQGALHAQLDETRSLIRAMGARMADTTFEVDGPAGSVTISQVGLILQLIDTLDTYISTGIGYAHPVSHLAAYLNKHVLGP